MRLADAVAPWQDGIVPNRAGGIHMRESFEHFYLTKVGLGEGCGCAEHVTRIRELDSYAASTAWRGRSIATPMRPLLWVRQIFLRLRPRHAER
jgi:hypothetical protein